MPLSKVDRVRSCDLLCACHYNGSDTSVCGAISPNTHLIPVDIYGCVGNGPSGPCKYDKNFICDVEEGQIGLIAQLVGRTPNRTYRGLCEIEIISPNWVFNENGATSKKTRVKLVIAPAPKPSRRPPKTAMAPKNKKLHEAGDRISNVEIVSPEMLPNQHGDIFPSIMVTSIWEDANCTAPSRSIFQLKATDALSTSPRDGRVKIPLEIKNVQRRQIP